MILSAKESALFLIEKAQRRRADGEAYIVEYKTREATIENNEIQNTIQASGVGVAFRVSYNGKMGLAYASGLDRDNLYQLFEDAFLSTKYAVKNDFNAFAEPPKTVPIVDIYDSSLDEGTIRSTIEHMLSINRIFPSCNPIRGFDLLHYTEKGKKVFLANTKGLYVSYPTSDISFWGILRGKNKENEQSYSIFHKCKFFPNEAEVTNIAKDYAHKLSSLLMTTKEIKNGEYTTIFSPQVTNKFLYSLLLSLRADIVIKRGTFLSGRLNEKVASNIVDVVDDGTKNKFYGTLPVDDEGIPAKSKTLIKNGVLKGFLHTISTARQTKTEPTGNAKRYNLNKFPSVGATNFFIATKDTGVNDLIASTVKGVYLCDSMGHGFDIATGNFSLPARGVLVERGEIIHSVNVFINTKIESILKNIEGISDVLGYPSWTDVISPTIKVRGLFLSHIR